MKAAGLAAALLAGWFAAAPVAAYGQTATDYYRFAVDQDHLSGAPDFSFLNHPLSGPDRVFVRDGHFYTLGSDLRPNTRDDRRVRFFGVSIAFGANFPDPDNGDAVRIAKRLRRMGINLVRLHHMDSVPDPVGDNSVFNSTLTVGPYPSFNENGLKRLRAFLNALANEGIYVDLNLHVGYPFRPDADQVPALPGAWPDQGKPLQVFYPRMVQLQQQYAQGLIDKLELGNDPVLAMVEISNESSIVSSWQGGQLDAVLVGEYRAALQAQWNAWLAAKYKTTAALSQAWGTSTPDGPNLLNGTWQLEVHSPATANVSLLSTDGIPTVQVHVSQAGNWVFLKQTGFSMTTGNRYLWTFQARANLASGATVTTPVSMMRDDSPWDGYLYSSITLSNQWRTYSILASASFDITVNPSQPNGGRVSIETDGVGADTFVRGMSLVQAGQRGLAGGESIEAGNISLPGQADNGTNARLNDYVAFLTSVDRNYVNMLRDTVRSRLPSVPITGTQICFGGLSILDSQDGLDYQDNHFYIDHPGFPGIAWDPWDWRIQNAAAADSGWSSFLEMAWSREAGRPYTVSEFNQPWPNTHGAEIDASLAAFASFQDWDAIMHFDYAGARNWDSPIPSAFDANGDWTKFPLMGQSAWIFRTGAFAAGATALNVPVSAVQRIEATANSQSPMTWVSRSLAVPQQLALTRRVQLAKDSADPLPAGATNAISAPYAAGTGELVFDPDQKLMLLKAPMVAGIIGNIGTGTVRTAGPIDVQLAAPAAGFGSIVLNALDQRAIDVSGWLLISVPGYALRSLPAPRDQAPDAGTAKPQDLVNYLGIAGWWTVDPLNAIPTWGTWMGKTPPSGNMGAGYPPTFMRRVECWITLHTQATAVNVVALDGAGRVAAALPASEIQAVKGGFRIHLNGDGQTPSPWFVVTAVQPVPRGFPPLPRPVRKPPR